MVVEKNRKRWRVRKRHVYILKKRQKTIRDNPKKRRKKKEMIGEVKGEN